MNVYPKACFFVGMGRAEGLLRLTLTRDTVMSGKLFGAFKGAAWPFASLCRLLFIASHRDVDLGHFPSRLLTTAPLRGQSFDLEDSVAVLVDAYLAGESVNLVEALTDACSQVEMRTQFEQNLMLADLVAVEEFFERGPGNVNRLKQRDHLEGNWVEPETLMDFLAVDRLELASTKGRIVL